MRRSCWVWLLILGSVAGAQTTRPATQPITYLGRPVDDRWVSVQFQRFRDKIAPVGDGQFLDVGQQLLAGPRVATAQPPAKGAVLSVVGRVRSIPEDGVLLVESVEGPLVRWAVAGVDTKAIADGQLWQGSAVYGGVVEHYGERLQAYQLLRPLTRAEFEQAISGGFRLVEWRVVKNRGGSSIESKPVR